MTYLLIAPAVACCVAYAAGRLRTASAVVADALDDAAFIAEQRAEHEQLLAGLDANPPDDRSAT